MERFICGHIHVMGSLRSRSKVQENYNFIRVLGAELSILDKIDSGLDVDALRDVSKAVNGLLTPQKSVLMITHYLRLLEYIKPNYIHIMEDGKIIKAGDISIPRLLVKEGYKAVSAT